MMIDDVQKTAEVLKNVTYVDIKGYDNLTALCLAAKHGRSTWNNFDQKRDQSELLENGEYQ